MQVPLKQAPCDQPNIELSDLLAKILVRDPDKRATIEQIRQHPWVSTGYPEPPPQYPPRKALPLEALAVAKNASLPADASKGDEVIRAKV